MLWLALYSFVNLSVASSSAANDLVPNLSMLSSCIRLPLSSAESVTLGDNREVHMTVALKVGVACQAAWVVGNIAGDSLDNAAKCENSHVLDDLCDLLHWCNECAVSGNDSIQHVFSWMSGNRTTTNMTDLVRNCAFALCNMSRGKAVGRVHVIEQYVLYRHLSCLGGSL